MGLFRVEVKVANPNDPAKSFTEPFLVDTGALYSFVPKARLESIGILPVGKRKLTLADGRIDEMSLGEAAMTVQSLTETLTCPVIFGPKDSLYLLGATALEHFGVAADPENKKLIPILAIIGGFTGSR